MPNPTRDQLEEALVNADAAGDAEAAKRLALALKNGEYAQTPGINVTPAQQEPIEKRIEGQIETLTPMVAQAEQRRIDSSPVSPGVSSKVVMDPETGLPKTQSLGPEVFDFPNYDPDASYLDYVDTSDPWAQRAAVAQRGATLGAGDEMVAAMAGPDAGEIVDQQYSDAYAERPLESLVIEGAAGIPTGVTMARAMGLGARGSAAVEGGVYGFNDPFIGGDSFESRSLNAVPGAIGGRVLGGIGAGTANQAQRQVNTWSGVDTIQKVANDEFGITLTEGQIKGDPKLRGLEDSAKKGALNDSANLAAREAFKDQERAAVVAARGLGGSAYPEANDAARAAGEAIQARTTQQREGISQAYDKAASYGAVLREEGVAAFPDAVRGKLTAEDALLLKSIEDGVVSGDGFSGAKSAISMIDQMSANADGALDFKLIEQNRRVLNRLIDRSKPEDARLVLAIKRNFDESIDDAVESALFEGDQAFIGAYRNARALNAKFEREWGANKVYEKIVQNNATPEQVVNFVLGGSKLAGDKNYDVLLQLKGALSEDPEAWGALQEAYVKKLFRQSEKTFNPKVMRDTLDELLVGKNQSFAQTLFDDQQYQKLRRFRSVVDSMIPPEGAINTSNSGILLQRAQTSANDLFTGLHATPGVRAIGRTVMGGLDKFGIQTQGRRVKRQLNPGRGMDTRPIEQGFPENRFGVPEDQLPGAAPPRETRTLAEGIDQVASGPTPAPADDLAAAMSPPAQNRPVFGRRTPDRAYEADANLIPDDGAQPPAAPVARPESAPSGRMTQPPEPSTLTNAVRNLGGVKTRYTSEGVQKNLSRGEFEGVPGLINDRAGKGADDMVRALQEDGFDIVDEDDLYRALDNERMGIKTYRIGEGEAYEADLDAYQAMLKGDEPVQNGLPIFGNAGKAEPALMQVARMHKAGKSAEEIAAELDFTTQGVDHMLRRALRYGFDIGQNSRSGARPAQNGLPAPESFKPGRKAQMPDAEDQGAGIKMEFKDGRPTALGKIYQFSQSANPETGKPWTRAEIADEMMISENQVSVSAHKLRKAGYEINLPASVSRLGVNREKRDMAIALKRQGLSNQAIADRINRVYGSDAVHGGTNTTANSVGAMLSKERRTLRESGEVVDFGLGVMLPSAAASMQLLPQGEPDEEQAANILGTEEEKRAAMARAMLGGYR